MVVKIALQFLADLVQVDMRGPVETYRKLGS
jgi:hypothetical protein